MESENDETPGVEESGTHEDVESTEPLTNRTPINWDDDEPALDETPESGSRDATTAPPSPERAAKPAASHTGFYMTYVSGLAAVLLVVALLGVGFVVGHYVDKPVAPLSTTSPSYTKTSLPSGYGFGGSQYPGSGSSQYPGFSFPNFTGPSTTPSATDKQAAKVAKEVDPGLVDINTGISYQDATAAGTGMVLSSDGIVLTNNHVIEAATSITVTDIATGKTYKAKVLGYDVDKDVAVLKMENASGLTTVTLGDSSSLKVSDKVVGIGNAGGTGGTPSYAAGTVVAKNQSITADSEENPSGSEKLSGLIETDADIQPGDSGGPLVTLDGKVVGMDTAASADQAGYEFGQSSTAQAYSIPINTAVAIAKDIEEGISTDSIHVGPTGILGIEVNPTSESTSTTSGVTVATVMSNTPAASSGLAAGDVITSFDGHSVSDAAQLSALEFTLKPGDSATITYVNSSGTTETATFDLTTGPAQ